MEAEEDCGWQEDGVVFTILLPFPMGRYPSTRAPPPQPYAELEMAADIPILVFILNSSVYWRAYEEWRPQHFGVSELRLGAGQQQAGVPRALSNPELYCTSVPGPRGIG